MARTSARKKRVSRGCPQFPGDCLELRGPVGATVAVTVLSAYDGLAELAFRVSEAVIGHVGC